jgi:hypothetical protein
MFSKSFLQATRNLEQCTMPLHEIKFFVTCNSGLWGSAPKPHVEGVSNSARARRYIYLLVDASSSRFAEVQVPRHRRFILKRLLLENNDGAQQHARLYNA